MTYLCDHEEGPEVSVFLAILLRNNSSTHHNWLNQLVIIAAKQLLETEAECV